MKRFINYLNVPPSSSLPFSLHIFLILIVIINDMSDIFICLSIFFGCCCYFLLNANCIHFVFVIIIDKNTAITNNNKTTLKVVKRNCTLSSAKKQFFFLLLFHLMFLCLSKNKRSHKLLTIFLFLFIYFASTKSAPNIFIPYKYGNFISIFTSTCLC